MDRSTDSRGRGTRLGDDRRTRRPVSRPSRRRCFCLEPGGTLDRADVVAPVRLAHVHHGVRRVVRAGASGPSRPNPGGACGAAAGGCPQRRRRVGRPASPSPLSSAGASPRARPPGRPSRPAGAALGGPAAAAAGGRSPALALAAVGAGACAGGAARAGCAGGLPSRLRRRGYPSRLRRRGVLAWFAVRRSVGAVGRGVLSPVRPRRGWNAACGAVRAGAVVIVAGVIAVADRTRGSRLTRGSRSVGGSRLTCGSRLAEVSGRAGAADSDRAADSGFAAGSGRAAGGWNTPAAAGTPPRAPAGPGLCRRHQGRLSGCHVILCRTARCRASGQSPVRLPGAR